MNRRKTARKKRWPRLRQWLREPEVQRGLRISLALFFGGFVLYLGLVNIEPLNATLLALLSALGLYMMQYPGERLAFIRYFSHACVSAYLILYMLFCTRFIHTLETAGYITIFMSFLFMGMGKGSIPPRRSLIPLDATHKRSLLKAWLFSSAFLLGAGLVIFIGLHRHLLLTVMMALQGATGIFIYFYPRLTNWPRRLFPNFVFTVTIIVVWDFFSSHHQLEDKLGLMLALIVLAIFAFGEARYSLKKAVPLSQ